MLYTCTNSPRQCDNYALQTRTDKVEGWQVAKFQGKPADQKVKLGVPVTVLRQISSFSMKTTFSSESLGLIG